MNSLNVYYLLIIGLLLMFLKISMAENESKETEIEITIKAIVIYPGLSFVTKWETSNTNGNGNCDSYDLLKKQGYHQQWQRFYNNNAIALEKGYDELQVTCNDNQQNKEFQSNSITCLCLFYFIFHFSFFHVSSFLVK